MRRENEFLCWTECWYKMLSLCLDSHANTCRMIAISVLGFTILYLPFFLRSMRVVHKQRLQIRP